MPDLPPIELVTAARNGGRAETERLVTAIWPDAYRLAFSVTGDEHVAQDAAQEACIIAYRTIASLRHPEAFRAWFYRIVVREASELRRRTPLRGPATPSEAFTTDTAASLDIWRALSDLPATLRDVVVLR